MRRLTHVVLAAAVGVVATLAPTSAHKLSDSYLSLRVNGPEISGQWEVALRDLDHALGLDRNNDGVISWGELRAQQPQIATYLLSRLTLRSDGQACSTRVSGHLVDDHSDGAYEVLRFAADCPAPPRVLDIGYDFFFDFDPQHRGLLNLQINGKAVTAVFGPSQKTRSFEGDKVRWGREFAEYFREGVWHIWTGFDHMLFLCALLFPAVLIFRSGKWVAVADFRQAFGNVFKIVTAFTLAHSITLSLAALGYIALPSRLVESAIAVSVIAAALNNIYPLVRSRLWVVAFGFGLVHGLGFANVLVELGLPADALTVALVGFNLGVEAGQLAVIGLLLPLAYLCRRSRLYPRLVLGAGSASIVLIASVWLIERTLDVDLFS